MMMMMLMVKKTQRLEKKKKKNVVPHVVERLAIVSAHDDEAAAEAGEETAAVDQTAACGPPYSVDGGHHALELLHAHVALQLRPVVLLELWCAPHPGRPHLPIKSHSSEVRGGGKNEP
jgi:hypothetical protein